MSFARPDSDAAPNPFCTRCVRPGAIPFLFPEGETAADLVARFQRMGRRGAVVGPHGSGKSTLLATLLPEMQRQGQQVSALALRDGQRRLPRDFLARHHTPDTVLVVDGYEQLGFASRCRLRWLCWRRQLGLLVTAHAPVGLPVLARTAVDLPLALRIVSKLQEGFPRRVHEDDVVRVFPQCDGNLRETLFALFDLYEAGQRKGE